MSTTAHEVLTDAGMTLGAILMHKGAPLPVEVFPTVADALAFAKWVTRGGRYEWWYLLSGDLQRCRREWNAVRAEASS